MEIAETLSSRLKSRIRSGRLSKQMPFEDEEHTVATPMYQQTKLYIRNLDETSPEI